MANDDESSCGWNSVAELINGQRQGPFLILEDELRHAVRLGAILSVSEMSGDCSATVVQLSGKRSAVVRQSFEQVLSWLT